MHMQIHWAKWQSQSTSFSSALIFEVLWRLSVDFCPAELHMYKLGFILDWQWIVIGWGLRVSDEETTLLVKSQCVLGLMTRYGAMIPPVQKHDDYYAWDIISFGTYSCLSRGRLRSMDKWFFRLDEYGIMSSITAKNIVIFSYHQPLQLPSDCK